MVPRSDRQGMAGRKEGEEYLKKLEASSVRMKKSIKKKSVSTDSKKEKSSAKRIKTS
jgi:hypothetical protein